MSGQSAAKTVKEVKGVIRKIEDNQHLKGGGNKHAGTETNANGHPGSRPIGGGKYKGN